MKSHTVPYALLDQFSFDDPVTNSRRMWRYEKGRSPRWDSSPRTATRIDRHLADPSDAMKEEMLEKKLNKEVEVPVNEFLFRIGQPGVQLNDVQRGQLTRYVTLLFLRSDARKKASGHTQEVMRHAMHKFIANDLQVLNVSAKWSIEAYLSGIQQWYFTPRAVIRSAQKYFLETDPTEQAKKSYVRLIETAITTTDIKLLSGRWDFLRTSPGNPFVISDAPVVSWQRNPQGLISYGCGFHREDVEVFMPVSPVLCLHILPDVNRTRPLARPSVEDINAGQAALCTKYCYTNVNSPSVDKVVQEFSGQAEMGVKSFTVWHRNYDRAFYDLFMGNTPDWINPPRKA